MDAKPIRLSTARNIAFGYREETKKELDKMVSQGIIKPVGDKATEWCSPMIVVQKPGGDIRICVDLSKPNEFIKRPTHPGASRKRLFWTIRCIRNIFQPWLLLKDIGKYFLQKNFKSCKHSSHHGEGINTSQHLWDLVQLETSIIC